MITISYFKLQRYSAAIDTVEFTDNFICRSSITRSDMLFITFGSSIFAKELPAQCLDRRPNLLLHDEGILLCFAYRPLGLCREKSIRLLERDGYLVTNILFFSIKIRFYYWFRRVIYGGWRFDYGIGGLDYGISLRHYGISLGDYGIFGRHYGICAGRYIKKGVRRSCERRTRYGGSACADVRAD